MTQVASRRPSIAWKLGRATRGQIRSGSCRLGGVLAQAWSPVCGSSYGLAWRNGLSYVTDRSGTAWARSPGFDSCPHLRALILAEGTLLYVSGNRRTTDALNGTDVEGEVMLAFSTYKDERRTARLEQRMSPRAKEIIEHAAALQGVTASEFALSHTMEAAQETISRMETTRLAPEDRDAFFRALDDERPNAALIDIFELHAQANERAAEHA